MSAAKFIPYGRQSIDAEDIAAVVAALQSDYLTTGPMVEAFEQAFAHATGAEHAVSCNSGTAALHLAALAFDLQPGDAVVVPTLTFLATANVVRMCGADVVFSDVDPHTGLVTATALEEALARVPAGKSVRAAFPVHLNGQVCDMEALSRVAVEAGIEMVEDACHALGAPGIGATKYSQMACFSTHAVKAVATGEGGVVTTADAERARRMRSLRSHGILRDPDRFRQCELAFNRGTWNPWYYEMQEIGWNYRMPDILCALGMSQLKKLDEFSRRRREIAALYDELLRPLFPAIQSVPHGQDGHGWHLYAVLVDFAGFGISRGGAMERLRAAGVGTQVHYLPVHRQPYYRGLYGDLHLPGADSYYERCLSLPFFPAMSNDDVKRVVTALRELAG
ncbi:UDP-4-amino-4,6-dideoxy-N-acetyl-beta-L-altrosamine transaminase [Hyphomicrobium sp.]|uniref:UDP-4-amino-4, 6-dideoxy-N-acetyl-beta-L-altrosamine transaminase n=1 Tax=Hyphomicrobium sp. TaxID=82 RepID=UPI0025BED1E2|nr:UDP-4-amino-4,6-dideoxy-N-acetyl-beta-L-altrosamine transaminase [Hyphomicrobium sp.]MCC7250957.1 UDP-4-amino-4,6-dideoxy-N-acetyl-beta-L-altrosamine transaminase [Hyphomicrobium sp.]